MIDIRIQQDYEGLKRNLDSLQARAVRPALNRTIGQLVRAIRTKTVRDLASKLQIQQKLLRRKVRGYNFGVRKLGGKVWLGYRRKIGVSAVKSMNPARAQQFAKYSPRVFVTKAKSGKKLFAQRVRSGPNSRLPIVEPKVEYQQLGKVTVNQAAVEIFNERYQRIMKRELENKLKRRNLFDLRALNVVEEIFD